MSGIFTISLDFELHWGVFDKRPRDKRRACYQNTLTLVPQMLQLFEQHKIHVTWATVGSLFANNKEEWESLVPLNKPAYENSSYSAYGYIAQQGFDPTAHLAPDHVLLIEQFEGQELSTHTFSHYYCLEKGQTAEAFDADLKAAIAAADKLGVSRPQSIVFPRNQYNAAYLNICYKNGIRVIRSNPNKWFWSGVTEEEVTLSRKVMRTGDTYLAIGGKMTYPLKDIVKPVNGPMQLPASRFLRSYDPKRPLLNKLRLKRILGEMDYAARNNEVYHLWWHPEQFGDYPQHSINDLVVILQQYSKLRDKQGMISLNMKEYLTHPLMQ